MQVKIEDHFLGEVANYNKVSGKLLFPDEVIKAFKKRLFQIRQANSTADLRKIGSLHFEKLKGKEYEGKYSIRLNISYRLIFRIENSEGSRIETICIRRDKQSLLLNLWPRRPYTFMNNQVLDHNGNEIEIEAFHPGEFLKEEIEERNLLKKDVAKALNILPHHLSEIFAGKRNISATLAVRLEKLLEISSHYWLGLQMEYDLFIAKQEEALA